MDDPKALEGSMSAIELMKLPAKERVPHLARAAKEAAKDYMNDPELTAFEVFIADGLDE